MKPCLIYNYAQHYRLPIFQLLNYELGCDFYFGDKMKDVRKLEYKLLPGYKKELKNIHLFSIIYWQKGALSLFFKNYDTYIILGEYYCLSTWVILLLSKFSKKKYIYGHTAGTVMRAALSGLLKRCSSDLVIIFFFMEIMPGN